MSKPCCGTCQYGDYDELLGYICVNDASEYVADLVEHDQCCDEYEENGDEDVCEWSMHPLVDAYKTRCEHLVSTCNYDWEFCQYCGKKIKVVER